MRHEDDPVLVTTAAPSPAAERDARERRYLITMGVRVVAFIAAIFLARTALWLGVITITLSLVLPWVAVVSANAPKRTRDDQSPSLYRGSGTRQLGGGPDRSDRKGPPG